MTLLLSRALPAKSAGVPKVSKQKKVRDGLRIRRYREAKGLTGAELNRRAGFEGTRLNKYESGINSPSPEAWRKIAAALGVSIDELMGPPDIGVSMTDAEVAAVNAEFPRGAPKGDVENFLRGLRRGRAMQSATAADIAEQVQAADEAESAREISEAGGQQAPVLAPAEQKPKR